MAKEATAQETQEKIEKEQSLENFDWDTDGTGDFFGIKGTGVEPDPKIETEKKENKKEDPPAPEEEEEEEGEENISFFEIEKETADEEESEEEVEVEFDYETLTKRMQEKSIFQNVEIPEGEELTEDKFIEYHDQEIESRVEEALEGFLEELDEDGKAFLKFKKDGGNTKDFLATYQKSQSIPEGDLEEEAYQEQINRYYYREVEGLDEADVQDRIEWLKDSGKLKKYAEKHDAKAKELDKLAKEKLKEQAKANAEAQKKNQEAFVNGVTKALEEVDEVGDFVFDKKTKARLKTFITKPNVKVGKNQYVTGMQVKLQETLKNPEKMLLLAKLLESDFDVSEVATKAKTQTTKKVKTDIQRSKTVRPSTSGKTGKTRSLADFF